MSKLILASQEEAKRTITKIDPKFYIQATIGLESILRDLATGGLIKHNISTVRNFLPNIVTDPVEHLFCRDVLLIIMAQLDAQSLLNLRLVCREFYHCANIAANFGQVKYWNAESRLIAQIGQHKFSIFIGAIEKSPQLLSFIPEYDPISGKFTKDAISLADLQTKFAQLLHDPLGAAKETSFVISKTVGKLDTSMKAFACGRIYFCTDLGEKSINYVVICTLCGNVIHVKVSGRDLCGLKIIHGDPLCCYSRISCEEESANFLQKITSVLCNSFAM